MAKDFIIEVNDVTKKVGKLTIVKDINLKIKQGEKIAILGANGSGKTTLIELISNITKPSSGEIIINSNIEKIKKIGLQFQEGYWPKGVTPKSIIKYYVGKKEAQAVRIEELAIIFGVRSFYNKDLNNLSGGEKQRFNSMLSVINNPEILILDELITGLDLKMQVKLINFFKDYLSNSKKTLLMISHIPEEVEALCERFILLENGVIINDLQVASVIKEHGSIRLFMEKYYEKMED